MMPWEWYFRWYVIWPAALGCGFIPLMTAVFFCRFCRMPDFCQVSGLCQVSVKRLHCAVYVILSILLAFVENRLGMKGSLGLVLETLLLACWGKMCLKKSLSRSAAVAVLLLSVHGAVNGIISWTERRLFFPIIVNLEPMTYLSDGLRESAKAVCMFCILTLVLKKFGKMIEEGDERILVWLTVPVFFLSMVERIIRNSIYGDNLVMDTNSGQVTTVIDINHGEMLLLQIFACLCLFLTMAACKRVMVIQRESEKTRLLEQQVRAQEIYVQEAEARLRQTRSFRHDIKNHLTILSEFLKKNQAEEAGRYLEKLEQVSSGLSMEVQTGNVAVSALLGSKIPAARSKGIQVRCELMIPENSGIEDIDWCVLLSNGMDNAIKACEALEEDKRYIKIKSQKKGNFYLITVENSCDQGLTKVPPDETGLSNIRATAEKYGGEVENRVADGVYRLKLLFTTERGYFTSEL